MILLFIDVLIMFVLYVSLGSSVTPNIGGGGVFVGSVCG